MLFNFPEEWYVLICVDVLSYKCVLQTGDNKVFSDLHVLEKKPAHMAIFLHYVLYHHNPAPLLFYQMASLYSNAQGSCKDLKKWAYEIHSTFIVHLAVSQTFTYYIIYFLK